MTTVQTTVVPIGGATAVELTLEVLGKYLLVDHALSRIGRGLLCLLQVDGEKIPKVFHQDASS